MEVLRNMRSRLLSHASVIASQPSYHIKTHLYCTKFSFSSKSNTLVVKPTMKNIKSMRKSSFSKRTVDAVEAYKTIYGNLDIKQRYTWIKCFLFYSTGICDASNCCNLGILPRKRTLSAP